MGYLIFMLQLLIDQKKEYIEHLQNLLAIPIADKLYNIYVDSSKRGLRQFQNDLSLISTWNNYIIEQETKQIIKKTKCEYLTKLLKLTINVCIKVKFYEYKNKLKHLKLEIPNIQDFIHKCLISASEFAWKNPYLFVQTNLKTVEIQNNLNVIEFNIRKMIAKTITEYINIQEIIDFLDEVMEKSNKKRQKKNSKLQHKISRYQPTPSNTEDLNNTHQNIENTEQEDVNDNNSENSNDNVEDDEENMNDKSENSNNVEETDEDEMQEEDYIEPKDDINFEPKNSNDADIDEKCINSLEKENDLSNDESGSEIENNLDEDAENYDSDIIQNIKLDDDLESDTQESDLDSSSIISSDDDTSPIKNNIKVVNITDSIPNKSKTKRTSFF